MSDLRSAIAEALKISQARRDTLRRALETGDAQTVFEAVRQLLSPPDDDDASGQTEGHCSPQG